MKLTFLGGTGTVTGSKFLLEASGKKILVDCGLFQGLKNLRLKNWAPLPIPPSEIAAIILTHAHIDHSGYIPLMVKKGFKGPIFCTSATAELCGLLLVDAGYLMEEEANFANRHGYSKHHPALPLYTKADADDSLSYLKPVQYKTPFEPTPGVKAQLQHAGHILGAAVLTLEAEGKRLVFSGDLGRPGDPVVVQPDPIPPCDYLFLESTYGDRTHPNTDAEEDLARVINETIAHRGTVVIPAFAVARAQTLLFHLYRLKKAGIIPESLPVYLDSPMAKNATRIFLDYPSDHRLSVEDINGLFQVARIVNSTEESKALSSQKGPMVLISASGMATGGRILHHLKRFAPVAKNTILFSGFQAAGTRGAAMVAGTKSVKIHGENVNIGARVEVLHNLSAHADSNEIVSWAKNAMSPPRMTFIVHGEPTSSDALRLRLERELAWNCYVPEYGESVVL